MQKLNLPEYEFRQKKKAEILYIFDKRRMKFLVLTPEEWVRQNIIQYLIIEKGFPKSLISSEAGLKVNSLRRRYDILIYSKAGKPLLLVECKAPTVTINQQVIDQIVAYNSKIEAPCMLLTNGLQHFFLRVNSNGIFEFQHQLPFFNEL
jgi:hypothetical protein